MFLRKTEFAGRKILCFQTGVNVTFEGEHSLFGILFGERQVPVDIALVVQAAQLVADAHQCGDLARGQGLQLVDQCLGLFEKRGLCRDTRY